MEEFRRDLEKAKRDDTLRALFNIVAKQTGVVPADIDGADRALLRAKKAELEKVPDADVTFCRFQLL